MKLFLSFVLLGHQTATIVNTWEKIAHVEYYLALDSGRTS